MALCRLPFVIGEHSPEQQPRDEAAQRSALADLIGSEHLWLMPHDHLSSLLGAARGADLSAFRRGSRSAGGDRRFELTDAGIARIEIRGVLTRRARWWWMDGTSMDDVRLAIDEAVADPLVRGILLDVSSPGGTVAGTQELAHAVKAAASEKPVTAHISDVGASAAYWIASQATRITANETATVGSIGVITRVVDSSGALERWGLKVHVVRSGPLKGGPQSGEAVSDEQLAEVQALIDQTAAVFQREVRDARGFGPEKMTLLGGGGVFTAGAAKELGLIDGVSSERSALAAFEAHLDANHPPAPTAQASRKGLVMSFLDFFTPKGRQALGLDEGNGDDKPAAADGGAPSADAPPAAPPAADAKPKADAPAAPTTAELAAAKKKADELEAQVKELREERQREKYLAEARNFRALPGELPDIAATLRDVDSLPEASATRIRKLMADACQAVVTAPWLHEAGHAGDGAANNAESAQDELDRAVAKLRAEDTSLSAEAAKFRVMRSNPQLANRVRAQN